MSFDWSEFLHLARVLKVLPGSPGLREAALRSAISRAYFAAHHRALDLAVVEGYLATQSGADHMGVIDHFSALGKGKLYAKIGINLDRLRDNRRKADYRQRMGSPADMLAFDSLTLADQIVTDLNALSAPSS